MSTLIDQYRDQVHEAARSVPGERVVAAAHALLEVHRRRGTVFVLCPPEDGESARHFVAALEQGIDAGPFQFRLVRLYGTPAGIIAWQNDWAHEDVYVQQMRAEIRPGDAVIVVSRRGQSLGLARALQAARRSGAVTLAVVGFDGGIARGLADVCLHVRCSRPEQVEDVQVMLAHMLSLSLRHLLDSTTVAREKGVKAGAEG